MAMISFQQIKRQGLPLIQAASIPGSLCRTGICGRPVRHERPRILVGTPSLDFVVEDCWEISEEMSLRIEETDRLPAIAHGRPRWGWSGNRANDPPLV